MHSILIVDDEVGIREILSRWLVAAGYHVRGAADADIALAEMTMATADLVMCDVEMPGHNGLWLAAQLHQHFPATAIVLATANDAVPPVTSLQPGIVEYLVKPFVQQRVLHAVIRGLRWHDAARTAPPSRTGGADPVSTWFASADDHADPIITEPAGDRPGIKTD